MDNNVADWDTGLTCYYDENSYLKLALACRNGQTGILSAEYVDDRYVTESFIPLEAECREAEFQIITEHLKRTLYFKRGDEWSTAFGVLSVVYKHSIREINV